MSSGLASARGTNVLDAMIGRNTITAWSGTVGKLKLMSGGTNNEAGDGTEISGGSYVAGGVTLGTISSTFLTASSYATGVCSIKNDGAAVTQSNMPTVGSPGVTDASIYDNGPVRWWWGTLTTPVLTNLGDTLTFATNAIVLNLNM